MKDKGLTVIGPFLFPCDSVFSCVEDTSSRQIELTLASALDFSYLCTLRGVFRLGWFAVHFS